MEYRSFKNGSEQISLLGLGCMRLPTLAEGKDDIDYANAQKIVDLAYANGVNYFDTAWFYHGGGSEEFTGKALSKYPRESYYLATKMPVSLLETLDDAKRIFDEQLKRTGAGYFDFYLCHALSAKSFDLMESINLYAFLEEKKAEGLIRHIGFSFHDKPMALRRICNAHPWEFAQIQLNYLDWTLYRSREQYQILEERGIPVIIMEPVRGGQLADLGPVPNAMLKKLQPQKSIASWAFRYAASLPSVITVLSGMSTLAQVEDNLTTFTGFEALSPREARVLNKARLAYKKNITIPCTACRYCVPCPLGVEIPDIFALYNASRFHTNCMERFQKAYAELPSGKTAAACVDCGKCTAKCPQQLPIPALLSKLHTGEKPV